MSVAWLQVALALLGPGIVALLWVRQASGHISVRTSAPWLAAFALLVATVATIALAVEGLSWAELGFRETSLWSLPAAIALALFFIIVFGPLASWALTKSRLGSFDTGADKLMELPRWYLALTIVVVAGGEEWLYRGYAIERLQWLIGDIRIAGAVSLLAFAIAHLPAWGVGASLTTLVSGGIFTLLYICFRDVSFLILAHVATDLYGLLIAPRRPTA